MDFENTAQGNDSYEKPNPGKYIGLLVGFAYVGTHAGGQYGPKRKVLLRWELHKRKGPSLDSGGNIHTISREYGATIKGENSLLKKALEAHGVEVPENGKTSSRDWLGKAAWLDLEASDDGKYTNVTSVSKLDPEDDVIPTRKLELSHWDDKDAAAGTAPPSWAAWKVGRSTDLAHLAPSHAGGTGSNGKPATRQPVVVPGEDDGDIPF
jgi:hypothetical protein